MVNNQALLPNKQAGKTGRFFNNNDAYVTFPEKPVMLQVRKFPENPE